VSIIDLSYNSIALLGAVKIAKYLKSNPPIQFLLLFINSLTSIGVKVDNSNWNAIPESNHTWKEWISLINNRLMPSIKRLNNYIDRFVELNKKQKIM